MIKSKKSESYLVDNNEKLLNKFELHQLLVEKNKKKILKLYPSKFLKLYSETNIFESIENQKILLENQFLLLVNRIKSVAL